MMATDEIAAIHVALDRHGAAARELGRNGAEMFFLGKGTPQMAPDYLDAMIEGIANVYAELPRQYPPRFVEAIASAAIDAFSDRLAELRRHQGEGRA